MNIGILGAGTWGIALARMLCLNGKKVTVWSAIESEIDGLNRDRTHPNLKGMVVPCDIEFTKDIKKALENQDIIMFAVPSVFLRSTVSKARPFIKDGQVIVDVAKGIEPHTMLTMSAVIEDEINKDGLHKKVKVVALSGPTHAEEVALDMPTTIVSASKDKKARELVQEVFMNENFRVYTNSDILGVELSGALKNIIALASGISFGLGYGDNSKAALITRGIKEISALGVKMGAKAQTFNGLAGIGDLIVTATSMHSRNNKAGQLIGQGYSVKDALEKVGMVVEGINAIPAAKELANKYGVELPIVFAVDSVVNGGVSPKEAVKNLMERAKKDEH